MADENEQSPFTRPWFLIAAVVIALVVVAGIILAVLTFARGDDPPSPDPSSSTPGAAPSASPTADEGGDSVCGLEGVELTGTVTTAPETEWQYQDVFAYPTSSTAGPGETSADGYRYCFQHSPEGALFMAANALVQGSGPASEAWATYALADGPYRDQLLSDAGSSENSSGIRMDVVGFRVLEYTGDTARIDLAVRGSSQGETITASAVYDLVWQAGDWKVSADDPVPFDFASIPDTAGYVSWRS